MGETAERIGRRVGVLVGAGCGGVGGGGHRRRHGHPVRRPAGHGVDRAGDGHHGRYDGPAAGSRSRPLIAGGPIHATGTEPVPATDTADGPRRCGAPAPAPAPLPTEVEQMLVDLATQLEQAGRRRKASEETDPGGDRRPASPPSSEPSASSSERA